MHAGSCKPSGEIKEHPVLGINPPSAGAAKPSRGDRRSCREGWPICPHRCSTFLMPSAKARSTFLALLPHAPRLMPSPLLPCLVPKRQALGGPRYTDACAKALTALPLPSEDISSPKA